MLSLHELRVPRPTTATRGGVVSGDLILALHPDRVEKIEFILYTCPPNSVTEDKLALDEWQERVAYIQEDLMWLLKVPHDKFWCQVIFDLSLQRCITSFLRAAPRPHDVTSHGPSAVKTSIDRLSRLVFLSCLRMSTCKESIEHFITPAVFGDIIYENFVFDIPRLFDICAVYGPTNRPLVEKMVDNIFRNQPKYHGDLRATIPTLLQVFDAVCEKCGIPYRGGEDDGGHASPKRLLEGTSSALVNMSAAQFSDVVSYVSDVGHTLWAFLEIYPRGADDLTESDFLTRLAGIYESLSGAFAVAFAARDWPVLSVLDESKRTVHRAQLCLLHVFQNIVFRTCLQPLLDHGDDSEESAERYILTMMSILGEKRFLAHYQHLYPFTIEEEILSQSSKHVVDDTRLQYIRDAVSEASRTYMSARRSKAPVAKTTSTALSTKTTAESKESNAMPRGRAIPQATSATGGNTLADDYQVDNDDTNDYDSDKGACASRITGVELDSLISSVLDLLPDLGGGFIKLCLEEYNYNVERVVNALLEDKLLPALQDIDRSLVHEVKPSKDTDAYENPPEIKAPSVLDTRRNIFDDDEFDVLSHDVDVSRIHRGKKEKLDKTFLDDRSSLATLKPLMERYGHEFVESMYDKDIEYEDVYEDEYDDTYDSNVVGAIDDDSADEMTSRRQSLFARPQDTNSIPRQTGRDDDREGSNTKPPPRLDQFVEDPAKMREMHEQRRATKEALRRKPRGGGPPPAYHPPAAAAGAQEVQGEGGAKKTYDVKGVAKGQGQSAEVLRNRAYKEKHKGGNHRSLADNKRRV